MQANEGQSAEKNRLRKKSLDWRVRFGLAITAAWIFLGSSYITGQIGWAAFSRLPAEQLGSFLEGAFAPLAFLWLVIGYFLQQKELEQNTQALHAQALQIGRTAEQAIIQSEKLAASELHARQEAFLQIAQLVRAQLGTITGLLYTSSQGDSGDGTVNPEEMTRLFSEQSNGDLDLFSRRLIQTIIVVEDEKQRFELFYGTAIRARHSNHFLFAFERLMRNVKEVDPQGMLEDALISSANGLLYARMKGHQANAPVEWSDHEKTGTQIHL
ncbi:MAG: hypothetical protein ACI8RT_000889 [Candidatus Azotimanducaceae bacterium]|jgi:hypothetical protein|tara:strand:- start:2519 stop:3328 length:810 start_codon:yes stop_codon:yes gene_type:complete